MEHYNLFQTYLTNYSSYFFAARVVYDKYYSNFVERQHHPWWEYWTD